MLTVTDLHVLNLAPVSLELAGGECVVLGGPSGSGKSLLLRAIADLDPARGDVRLDGTARSAMSGPDWRKKVRYFSAEPGWWTDRVSDHFPRTDAIAPLLTAFSLPSDSMSWSLERASTGEKQRLAFIRGVLDDPPVLLLDEPTSALDDKTARLVEDNIRRHVTGRGACAIIVTHDDAQAGRLAHRRLKIENGAVVEAVP